MFYFVSVKWVSKSLGPGFPYLLTKRSVDDLIDRFLQIQGHQS